MTRTCMLYYIHTYVRLRVRNRTAGRVTARFRLQRARDTRSIIQIGFRDRRVLQSERKTTRAGTRPGIDIDERYICIFNYF